ncbi:copper resistance protein [Helicobacter muridarum]|uniref:Copper resistance protein n=1 Tax=Helicobacter muridarum TaxID=216 RepID=A0A377PWZ8_9HELI|nr:FixH family protein [Helicobacter muridarum]TLD99277.1 copper resistance protein [Helicobacter muridarum]STQ86133.1 putative copper resistance determinant CrdA [Helicobacter muridarum]
MIYTKDLIINSLKRLSITLITIATILISNMALAFEKQIPHRDFTIILSSPKNFVSGKNEFQLSIKKGDKFIKDSDIKLTFNMPEMPGMPKMSELATLSLDNDVYKGEVVLPHGGTWQIRIQFSVDNKKYQAKSSIDF